MEKDKNNSVFCDHNEYCCGMHETCEKGLSRNSSELLIEYYDDEELDVFKGRSSDSYTTEETEQFHEVLTTMYATDVPGWLQSLKSRGIELPVFLIEFAAKPF